MHIYSCLVTYVTTLAWTMHSHNHNHGHTFIDTRIPLTQNDMRGGETVLCCLPHDPPHPNTIPLHQVSSIFHLTDFTYSSPIQPFHSTQPSPPSQPSSPSQPPKLSQVFITPRVGKVLVWSSFLSSGMLDPRALHTANPVTGGGVKILLCLQIVRDVFAV
jgi:hypothetical protein